MNTLLDASRLESLLESARLLGSSLELDQQINHLLRTIMGRLLATRALVALDQPGGYRVAAVRGLTGLKPGDRITPEAALALGLNHRFDIEGQDGLSGFLAVNDPLHQSPDQAEQEFMRALAGLAAASISNARAHQEALKSNQELRAMLELSASLAAAIDPEEVARLLMLTLAGRWALMKHGLVTWKAGTPPVRRLKGIEPPADTELQAALSESAPARLGAMVILPIRFGEETAGAVLLGAPASGRALDEEDLEFAAGLVSLAGVALDNAWRVQDTLYRQRVERELSLAASIQLDLFPKHLPPLEATELAARNRPAREVGGDYYDVLSVAGAGPAGPHLLAVADISGKGIGASLLMANIQATLRALLSVESSLGEITRRTSDLLYGSTPQSKYATAILVKYDPSTGACDYINAGHNEALIRRASGEVERLDSTSMPLALFPGLVFPQSSFQLGAGDVLMLYSDGVTDACGPGGEEYGIERLIDRLRQFPGESLELMVNGVFESIDAFAGAAPQHDDITVLVLRRTGQTGAQIDVR
jgi:sigma-B regulation protein RsbU (phosphoserine phosphatase)